MRLVFRDQILRLYIYDQNKTSNCGSSIGGNQKLALGKWYSQGGSESLINKFFFSTFIGSPTGSAGGISGQICEAVTRVLS